jgi:dodecin
MAESVYKVIELVGTSPTSWEKAAAAAVKLASQSLRDLRVAEVTTLDMHLEDGKVLQYRARVKVSFKYGSGPEEAPEEAPAPAPKRAAAKKTSKKSRRRA